MKRNIISVVILFSLIIGSLGLVGCGKAEEPSDGSSGDHSVYDATWVDSSIVPEEEGASKGLENFSTLDLYGNPVDKGIFASYKVTVVDVWGTYCNPCISAMTTLAKIYKEYEPQGVNVIGLVSDVQSADYVPKKDYIMKAMEITDKTGASFTHILFSQNIVSGVGKDIIAIPASFIVDSEGKLITEISYGSHTEEQWREILNAYI